MVPSNKEMGGAHRSFHFQFLNNLTFSLVLFACIAKLFGLHCKGLA